MIRPGLDQLEQVEEQAVKRVELGVKELLMDAAHTAPCEVFVVDDPLLKAIKQALVLAIVAEYFAA